MDNLGDVRRPIARDFIVLKTPIHLIALEVAKKYGLTLEELRGAQRSRRVAWPRQEAFWRASKETLASLPAIGRFFNKDHTTVLQGIRSYEKRMGVQVG